MTDRFSLEAMDPIVVIGAGGHAKVVIEAIRSTGGRVLGVLDPHPQGPSILGAPVLGSDDQLENLRDQGVKRAFIALGRNSLREKIGQRVRGLGMSMPTVVHATACVSPSAEIGEGAIVMARAVIGVETQIADFAIVNTGAVMDHDNRLGIAGHVAPGCALAGNVLVGDRAFVGVGSSVRPGIRIGNDAIIGAGSAVVADVAEGTTVVGVPARLLRPVRSTP